MRNGAQSFILDTGNLKWSRFAQIALPVLQRLFPGNSGIAGRCNEAVPKFAPIEGP